VKWTKTQPKVSGYYWLKEGGPNMGYCTPCVVRVKIDNDIDCPTHEVYYTHNEYEHPLSAVLGLWAGPIKPPKG
jgi:hypothetical protein